MYWRKGTQKTRKVDPEKVASELRKSKRALQYTSRRLNLCAWNAWAWVLKELKGDIKARRHVKP